MKFSLLAFTALAAAAPSLKMDVEKRGSGIPTAFLFGAEKILADAISGEALACQGNFGDVPSGSIWYNTGQAANGIYWMACYANDTDLVPWLSGETRVAQCLTDLHSTQASTCISTLNSPCDQGYVASGGRLSGTRELIIGDGDQGAAQISPDTAEALKDGMASLEGVSVQGTGFNGPIVVTTTDDTFTQQTAAQDLFQIRWMGEPDC